jgi:hypothetical protein
LSLLLNGMRAKFKYFFSLCLLLVLIMGQSFYMDILLVEKVGIRIAHINSYAGDESTEGEWFVLNNKTLPDVRWVDEREFEFQGEMYDIESSHEVDGNRQLRVKKDKRETELNRQIEGQQHSRSEYFVSDISSQVNKIFEMASVISIQIDVQFSDKSYCELNTERVENGYYNKSLIPPDSVS